MSQNGVSRRACHESINATAVGDTTSEFVIIIVNITNVLRSFWMLSGMRSEERGRSSEKQRRQRRKLRGRPRRQLPPPRKLARTWRGLWRIQRQSQWKLMTLPRQPHLQREIVLPLRFKGPSNQSDPSGI